MSWNLSYIASNTTGILSFIQGVNTVLMQGWLGVLLLIAITVICFMAFMVSTNDVRKSIIGSSFIAFGLSLFLKAMSLVPNLAIFICLIAAAASVAWSFSNE